MQIIKDHGLTESHWLHLADDQMLPACDDITVSYRRWSAEKNALAAYTGRIGLRLTGDDPLESIGPIAGQFPLLVIEFPTMADGRGFSIARLLRDRYAYRGEIRAHGQFIRDQVFFLRRVGVDAFEPSAGNAADLLPAFDDFSVCYQAAHDAPPSSLTVLVTNNDRRPNEKR